jgi:ABC-type arginine transport system permease subunit
MTMTTTLIFFGIAAALLIASTIRESEGLRIVGIIALVIGIASTGVLGGGDCRTDWDGRSNPTVCED